MEDKEVRAMCLELLETGWPAYLTTVDARGYPQTRAMFNLRNREWFPSLVPIFKEHYDDFMILFGTNTSSTKLTDIKQRSAASVYYCKPENWKGAMFGGDLEILDDMELKRAIWQEGWERYYPEGVEDPDYIVLRILPTVARGWTGSSTFKIQIGDGI